MKITYHRTHSITTQAELRNAFWEDHSQFLRGPASKRQNSYSADIRMAFVDYIDTLARNGTIPQSLALRATL